MRELTAYEKERWLDSMGRFGFGEFGAPEYLFQGAEDGEAYDLVERATHMGSYGLSDEFVAHAVTETLDMYYFQMAVYEGQYGDEPEEVGLPSYELFDAKAKELGIDPTNFIGGNFQDLHRQLWDWAMDWRTDHLSEFYDRQHEIRLRKELERIESAKRTS